MIINKEGKLFGKISIVDIAVVLIVILLAIGIYTRFSGIKRSKNRMYVCCKESAAIFG